MAKFSYTDAVVDSFKLVFKNIYIFIPILLMAFFNFFFTFFYTKIITPERNFDTVSSGNMWVFILVFSFLIIISFVGSMIFYGWFLALLGKIIRKGKAYLADEFLDGIRKGFRLFLVTLLIMVVLLIVYFILFGLIMLSALLGALNSVLAIISAILSLLIFFAVLIISIMAVIYVAPIIAMGGFGVIDTIKESFYHFRDNKIHTLLLLIILVIPLIIVGIINFMIIFIFTGSITGDAMFLFMIEKPVQYILITFLGGLPSMFFMVWGFAFLTISYVRMKKLS